MASGLARERDPEDSGESQETGSERCTEGMQSDSSGMIDCEGLSRELLFLLEYV